MKSWNYNTYYILLDSAINHEYSGIITIVQFRIHVEYDLVEVSLMCPYKALIRFHLVLYGVMVDIIVENNFCLFSSMTTNNDAVAIGILIS